MRRFAGIAVVAIVTIAFVVPAPFATLWSDTVRDASASLALARGEAFPLAGPSINFGPSLGPAWIWVQSVPFLFGASLAAASVYVAILASLKFGFYYGLGRTLSGERLGVCLAVAAALPSIAVFQWVVFFHPDVVESAIAAALFVGAAAVKRKSVALVYLSAAVLGLAVQFHPTALFYYPLVLFALLRTVDRKSRLALHAAGTVLMIAVWFAPTVTAGVGQRAGLESVAAGIAASLRSFRLSDVATVWDTAYVQVPLAIGDTYAARAGVPPWIWDAAVALAACVCVGGLMARFLRREQRELAAVLTAYLLAAWLIAVAVRFNTSFYLCYFILPLSALVMGIGLDAAAASRQRALRVAAYGAMTATVSALVIAAAGALLVGKDARIESHLPWVGDLKHPAYGKVTATLPTASARDAAAVFVCAQESPVVLYGDLAYALAGSTALDFRVHCPSRAPIVSILGPVEGRMSLTALPVSEAKRLAKEPLALFAGLAAFNVKAGIYPAASKAIETQWYYFEQLRDRQSLQRISRSFHTGPGDALMILRLKPFDSRWRLLRVERDGEPASPALSAFNRDIFESAAAGSEWRIEFETDAPQWVDIHVF